MLTRFNIPIMAMDNISTRYNEKEIVKCLVKALPYDSIKQFPIGQYKIDLYLPQFKIAIECDEFGHDAYDKHDEEKREQFITDQLSCKWIRFDPYVENFCIFYVIRQTIKLLFI